MEQPRFMDMRAATPEDAEVICDLLSASQSEFPDESILVARGVAPTRSFLCAPGRFGLVVTDGGDVVSAALFQASDIATGLPDHPFSRVLECTDVVTVPRLRRQGLASALLMEGHRRAHGLGCPATVAFVDPRNESGRDFLVASGFKVLTTKGSFEDAAPGILPPADGGELPPEERGEKRAVVRHVLARGSS